MKIILKPLLLTIVASLALPGITHASPPLIEVAISAGGWDGGGGWTGTVTAPSGYLSRSSGKSRFGSGFSGSGDGAASATFGVLRTQAQLQMSSSNSGNLHFMWTRARFRDERTTNAPGRAGQSALVTIKYTITGNVGLNAPPAAGDQTGQSYSEAYHEIFVNGSGVTLKRQKLQADGNPFCGDIGCTNFLGVEQTVTYAVTLGAAYDFDVHIASRPTLYSFPGFQGQAVADLGHTLVWGGIVSVTTPDGTPINDYSDASLSGANYSAPIVPVCATPSDALVGWWPGDTNARDIEGGNQGVLENGATYAAGTVGQAFSFPTTGARVRVPHSAALDFNATQDYAIDFWMKAGPQTGAATLVEKNGGTYPYSVRLLPNGTLSASASDGTSTVGVTSTSGSGAAALGVVHDNLWHHVAVVFKHSTKTLELYIDGTLNASQSYTAVLGALANGQDLYFGAGAGSTNPFVGSLDEVDIHNGALTLAQIQAIVAAADLGKCRPAVAVSSAVSRKTHGSLGDLDINLPLSGTPGIECRSGGASGDYQIVATFAASVAITGSPQAEVVTGSGTIGSNGVASGGAVSVSGNTVTIPITGVMNAQTMAVRLNAADNGANTADVVIPLSLLVGDTNGNGSVSASDIGQVKSGSGQPVTGSNFRLDVTASGGNINASDIGLVKSRSGTQLPPP